MYFHTPGQETSEVEVHVGFDEFLGALRHLSRVSSEASATVCLLHHIFFPIVAASQLASATDITDITAQNPEILLQTQQVTA